LRLSSDFVGRTAVSVHEAAIKCSRFINVIKRSGMANPDIRAEQWSQPDIDAEHVGTWR
jgi:hypothetical protein